MESLPQVVGVAFDSGAWQLEPAVEMAELGWRCGQGEAWGALVMAADEEKLESAKTAARPRPLYCQGLGEYPSAVGGDVAGLGESCPHSLKVVAGSEAVGHSPEAGLRRPAVEVAVVGHRSSLSAQAEGQSQKNRQTHQTRLPG